MGWLKLSVLADKSAKMRSVWKGLGKFWCL